MPNKPSSSRPSPNFPWQPALAELPSEPGVYWFLGEDNQVLYVGKAKHLKRRVSSYSQPNRLNSRLKQMVVVARQVKWQQLDSELEAILIETELIRAHQPPFNVALKDDKTPLYIHITDQLFPRVLTARRRELERESVGGTVLGPFPSAYKLREVLQIARRIFPWCNQPQNSYSKGSSQQTPPTKPCFYYHLELCPGACVGQIDPISYRQMIDQLTAFLKGRQKEVVRSFEQHMKLAADRQEFEEARQWRDKVRLIKDVTGRRYRLKPDAVLPQLRMTLREESLVQLRTLLSTYLHVPKELVLERIEGYDVSNTQGRQASVSMVVFADGLPDRGQYRLFNIRGPETPHDYAMLQEALRRRQLHPEWPWPDLVVIDGGKGQLSSALKVWDQPTPVISIVKKPDRIIIPLSPDGAGENARQPRYQVVRLPADHPTLKLIGHIRDESHRFSKRQHVKRRLKSLFE
ncbi:MAG: hypothetical protein COU69_03715 [Candidatus Pacebacteria bacterium CG10_big_fil_rev_8_21_14_0_10_56_10]|nr:MAG: hypothetical protein COU69_03715 [Candidatus Pacebacteria bacterium CG10_big_fil_rev_8_21_14_0_10_56_10]